MCEDKHKKTEEEIKREYITPAIESSGWKDIKMERYFTDGRIYIDGDEIKRADKKRYDYLLSYNDLPLAIVEAKDNKHTIDHAIQQAAEYAQMLDVPFYYSSNGDGFLEHDGFTGLEREIGLNEFPSPEELLNRYLKGKGLPADESYILTEPYYFKQGVNSKEARYYQRVAIKRTLEAIAKGDKRILLVMATGTGKTFVAMQIIYALWKTRKMKKVLYLADRNVLIDQTMVNDFKPFAKVIEKIQKKELDPSYEIYMSLYQQLAGDEGEEPFKAVDPDFFDLIIVDECHRGSAKEDSQWRKILEYFSSATQIGLTATPKETKEVSNINYFGEPIYTYKLKDGIEDGFLAPYKVHRIIIDRDASGFRPYEGQYDDNGNLIEDRIYSKEDFDRNMVLDERTRTVAKKLTEYLKENGRYQKTIVFCVDTDHAERMRRELNNLNADITKDHPDYVVRITGNETESPAFLDDFRDNDSTYPVIATTSKMLTTGVDIPTCKVIAIDTNINSMTEFKQILGRGTRLAPDYDKNYFTLLDYRGASRLFADPDFDGEPIEIIEKGEGGRHGGGGRSGGDDHVKYRLGQVDGGVSVIGETVQILGNDGKLITESVRDYSKRNILGEYATLDEFLKAWREGSHKKAIIDELTKHGVLLQELRKASDFKDLDDFDLILHIAYDQPPLTKQERVNEVKKRGYLHKYKDLAREVLSGLLDKYMDEGISNIDDISILKNEPFRSIGSPMKIVKLFGGKDKYMEAVKELEDELYKEAA